MSAYDTTQPTARRTELVDAGIGSYVIRREESLAVRANYESWDCAPRQGRTTAFEAYVAALDREERAASAYQRLLELAAA